MEDKFIDSIFVLEEFTGCKEIKITKETKLPFVLPINTIVTDMHPGDKSAMYINGVEFHFNKKKIVYFLTKLW